MITDRTGDYVLVPRKATTNMLRRAWHQDVWTAILAARPAHLDELQAANDAVIEAAARLSNEVIGADGLFEAIARRELGNTNYTIIMQRAQEARAALALRDKALSTTRTET